MAVPVLVMTPVKSFGELIQQALQDTDLYRVTLVHTADQVLERVTESFPVVILDLDLEEKPIDLIEKLKEVQAELRIIAMKDEAGQSDSGLGEQSLAAFLEGAFYLPDLLDAIERVTSDLSGTVAKAAKSEASTTTFPSTADSNKRTAKLKPAPEWLQDVDRAAQHLTRLSLESAAQAALITRGTQLWAYAGQLPQPAADELAQSVAHYWARDGGSDLARFIRLEASNSEYMLYATGLGGDYVLALAFETEMPFSEIRSQASSLARELAHPPKDSEPVKINGEVNQTELEADEKSQPNFVATSLISDEIQPQNNNTEIPVDWRPDQDVSEGRQAFFEELLSSVEIPNPEGGAAPIEIEVPQSQDQETASETQTEIDDEKLSRLAALLQTSEVDESLGEVDVEEAQALESTPVIEPKEEQPGLVEPIDTGELDLPIDEVSLANLINATIEDDLPEIDLFTADFEEKESNTEAFENYLKSPAETDPPDYLVEVSLDDEGAEAVIEDHEKITVQDPAVDSKFPIPKSLIDIMQQQGDDEIEPEVVIDPPVETEKEIQDVDVDQDQNKVFESAEDKPFEIAAEGLEASSIENVQKIEVDPAISSDAQDLPAHLAETIPTSVEATPANQAVATLSSEGFEAIDPALHNLVYACVLVPRIPQHHLVGDLAIYLNQWVVQLGLAFGWRLEHIAIRPNYLHWVAAVPPATSPGHMVRNLREHASKRIFAEFPRLARENPSGDFWAPGYLIINGQTPLSHQVVQDFIGKTRQRQGTSLARHSYTTR